MLILHYCFKQFICIKPNMKPTILIFIFVIILAFAQNAQSQTSSAVNSKSKAPTRSEIEELFGKAVNCNEDFGKCFDKSGKEINCPVESKEIICFRDERRSSIRAEFNKAGFAKKIILFNRSSSFQALRAAERIIMLNGRGRLLKKDKELTVMDCETSFTEDYEFLTMFLWGKGCQGLSPGGITITWKG